MPITSFHNEHNFLSNFYPSIIIYDGITYPTVEHYFQALKTINKVERQHIAEASTPGKAKRLGRTITLRDDWETIKVLIMYKGLLQKFLSEDVNPGLGGKLLATDNELLIEGNNWHDNTWGRCSCSRITCIKAQPGKNYLGLLLMDVRSVCRAFAETRELRF